MKMNDIRRKQLLDWQEKQSKHTEKKKASILVNHPLQRDTQKNVAKKLFVRKPFRDSIKLSTSHKDEFENDENYSKENLDSTLKPSRATELRLKLQQSSKKRSQQQKMHFNENQSLKVQRVLTETNQSNTKNAPPISIVKAKNLNKIVHGQMTIVDELIANNKFNEARAFLKKFAKEIKECTQFGDFWCRLANIELKVGNNRRATNVFILGLRNCNDRNLLLKCSQFMETEMISSCFKLDNLDTLLEPPFSDLKSKESCDEDIGERFSDSENKSNNIDNFFKYNANSAVKNYETKTKKKAERIPNPCTPLSKRNSNIQTNQLLNEKSVAVGSVIQVTPVYQKNKQVQELLGNYTTLTPVRRSARLNRMLDGSKSPSTKILLESTNYTYTPNTLL